MTFDLYLAAFALGRLQPSDLPAAAMQALDEGCDSSAMAALAGVLPSERSAFEIEAMWTHGLREVGKAVPTRIEAGHRLKRHFAALVSSGKLPPRVGAREIVRLAQDLSMDLPSREHVGDGFGVAKLVGDYYSHEAVAPGYEHLHDEIDEELRTECERLAREGTA